MKRKTLLFLMLMALFVPLAMNGQTRSELTVADQGGINYNTYVPIEGLFSDDNFQHTQIIYPASMLTDMQGGRITKLTFYLGASQETATLGSTYQLRLGTTSQTAFSSGDVTYLTTVSSSAICSLSSFTVSANGTVVFDFSSSPYLYTSGSLVVDVRLTTKASGYKTTYFLGETGSIYYSAHSRNSSSVPTTGSAYSFMPKTTFTYSVSSTPYITLAPAAATVFTGFTQTLTATYGNVSGTPTITYSSSNTSVATVSGSGTTATVTAVAPGTATITATMTYQGATYTATCAINVENPNYCTPSFSSTTDYITNFTLGEIGNSTDFSSNGYGDYTNQSASLEPGVTATASLTSSSGSGTHAAAIWIDFNDNYVFESSERVGTQDNIDASSTVSISLAIPSDAAVGNHRLRVVYQYSVTATNINPCASASYGEGEDYTVVIVPASNCPAPTNLTVTNLMPTSATLNWEGDAESYNVRYRVAAQDAGFFDDFENGLGNWTLIVNAQGTGWQTFDATRFEGGTNYSGNYVAMARSYENGEDITADNWMISSKFTSLPNTMTYWAKNDGRDDHLYDETYDVCVSTNTNSTSNFVIVQTFTTTPNEWSQITIDLSAYAGREGYIAFHHHDAEKDMLLIDDILIGSLNTISVGEWIEASTTNNFINITGLSSETTYEFQVQANCGTDGISG